MKRLRRDPCTNESGLTMIELIVAALISVIITGAAVTVLITAFQRSPQIASDAGQVATARVAIEKLTRELREGVVGTVEPDVDGATDGIRFDTYGETDCGSQPCRVTYSCGDGGCTRAVAGVSGQVVVVSGISNESGVFTPQSRSSSCPGVEGSVITYVTVRLDFPEPDEEGTTTLEDGAGLRSCPSP